MPEPVTSYLLMLEAVNFDATLLDVDDMSAIRGGGEAMLEAPKYVLDELIKKLGAAATITTLYTAASQALARVDLTDATKESIAIQLDGLLSSFDPTAAQSAVKGSDKLKELMPHLIAQLTYAWALELESKGLDNVRRELRLSQMRRLSVDIPPAIYNASANDRPCQHDWVRPRNTKMAMPDFDGNEDTKKDLSFFTALRRKLGRTGRRADFYARVYKDAGLDVITKPTCGFANHFGELVENPPEKIPDQIAGKIALISFDANGMGAMIKELATDPDAAADLANQIKKLRAQFLQKFINWAQDEDYLVLRKADDKLHRPEKILRLETLIWGADETTFVCPAWAIQPVLEQISELMKADKWEITVDKDKKTITHAVGVVICSHKSPIRLMKQLADDLTNSAKEANRKQNTLQHWASGGVDMPTRELPQERRAIYGTKDDDNQHIAYTLALDDAKDGLAMMANFKGISGQYDVGVPRDKLVKLYKELFATNGSQIANKLQDLLKDGYTKQAGGDEITQDYLLDDAFVKGTAAKDIKHAPLIHLLELWPYIGLDLSGTDLGEQSEQAIAA
jgi:hypothetical protein